MVSQDSFPFQITRRNWQTKEQQEVFMKKMRIIRSVTKEQKEALMEKNETIRSEDDCHVLSRKA